MERPEEFDENSVDSNSHYRQHVGDLEMELQSTRENLQTTVEELQTSNEELQATNEELLASNEELQSTNEELHSVNEELYSVNSEFERKNIDLKQLNTDHDNLLGSIDIGTIFLDRQMRIRKFNPAIAAFFKLLPQDIGRPIDHIAYHLSRQEELLANISLVLNNGEPLQSEESTRDGKWLLNRIMPFRTETGQVEGVVITFTDISRIKEAELNVIRLNGHLVRLNEELDSKVAERTRELTGEIMVRQAAEEAMRKQEHFTSSTLDALSAHICVIDAHGTIVISNRSWTEYAAVNCNCMGADQKPLCESSLMCEKRRLSGDSGGISRYLHAFSMTDSSVNPDAGRFIEGVSHSLSGEKPGFVMEYRCHSPVAENWFIVRVNRLVADGKCYAVISHENISARKQMERELFRMQQQIEILA